MAKNKTGPTSTKITKNEKFLIVSIGDTYSYH